MGVLSQWQKISRVLGGLPFGNGSAGNTTISSDPNTRATVIGTADATTSTLGSAILQNGDICILHQTQGAGAGQWEVQKVLSGGGTTSITWLVPLKYTYGAGAQCIKFSLNLAVTVNAHSPTAWNGSTGGVEVICGRNSITIAQALIGTGLGFRGGNSVNDSGNGLAYAGEGTVGATIKQTSANGNGGGGGNSQYQAPIDDVGGGGGGNGAAGSPAATTYGTPGAGGLEVGAGDLTTIDLGGGGGGASAQTSEDASNGGNGGSIVILISKSVIITGSIVNGGNNSGSSSKSTGGGGAGGSVLIVAATVTLGSALITALGGTSLNPTDGDGKGGDGSVGRVAVHHSGAVTGTSNPTFTDVSDGTLVENIGGYIM